MMTFRRKETYLLELLDLGLLKHGEDVRAGLLSSPLSLIRGLFTRLQSNNNSAVHIFHSSSGDAG